MKAVEIVLGGENRGISTDGVVVFIQKYSQTLPTERMLNLCEKPYTPKEGMEVYYSSKDDFGGDIYKFMLVCRASKLTKNHYYLGSHLDDKKVWVEPYNIVSGDALPERVPHKKLVFRYIMQGLHMYWIFFRRGLLETEVLVKHDHSRVVSTGKHYFQKEDAWAINMSNTFVGIMIDYYQIKSAIVGIDSQLAFTSDPEYRLLIARVLKSIFLSFVRNSSKKVSEDDDNGIFNQTIEILKERLLD